MNTDTNEKSSTQLEASIAVIPHPGNIRSNPWGDIGWLVRIALRPANFALEGKVTTPIYGAVCRHTGDVKVLSEKEFQDAVVDSAFASAQFLILK